jgi:hypothetical protein
VRPAVLAVEPQQPSARLESVRAQVLRDPIGGLLQSRPARSVAGLAVGAEPFAGVRLLDGQAPAPDLATLAPRVPRRGQLCGAPASCRPIGTPRQGALPIGFARTVEVEDKPLVALAVVKSTPLGTARTMRQQVKKNPAALRRSAP